MSLEATQLPKMTSPRYLFTRPAFIFLVALALRLATGAIFLHGGHYTIDSAGSFTEGYEAVNIAQSLASGNGFSRPWPGAGSTAWLTPVMPMILAADMFVFGLHTHATLIAFVIFNELCSALTIFPVFFAAKRIAGRGEDARIAALGAWLLALSPVAGLAACKLIWYTTLSGLIAAWMLWATLAILESRKMAAWIGYGLLWGLLLMVHPSFLVLMPVTMLWLVLKWQDSKRLTLAAVAFSTAVLCCVPWAVRNFVVFHHLVPLRSNFGFELWRYNHDGKPVHPNSDAVESREFSSLGEYGYVQEKQREALIWINGHPGAYLRATVGRVTDFWFGLRALIKFARPGGWYFKVKSVYVFALLVMMLGGLITVRRKRREYFLLLASFPAIFPLVYYLTIASDFHRVPIDPILAIIAAFALTGWLPTESSEGNHVSPTAFQFATESARHIAITVRIPKSSITSSD